MPFSLPITAFLFDLDDTLYAQRDYVCGAYQDIAKWASATFSIAARPFFASMMQLWDQHGSRYPRIFSEVLEANGISHAGAVKEMVRLFNAHQPTISPFPETPGVLATLRCEAKLGLVTDGHAERQRTKLAALGIADFFDVLVFTGDWGPDYYKPHQRGYREALESIAVEPEQAVFVGDSPEIDLLGAKQLGMHTVCVQHHATDSMTIDYADIVVHDLREILAVISM